MTETISLQCTECDRINYTTLRNKKKNPNKIAKKKFCRWDNKHTDHKESK